jgi:hypothetical protein
MKTENALQKCSRCKNVAYCDAKCQRGHWVVHKKNCRASGDTEVHEEVWAVVLPGDPSRRPYATLLPVQGWGQFISASFLKGRPAGSPVSRGHEVYGVFMLHLHDPPASLSANCRASAILTPQDGNMNMTSVSGPGVKVRGDAVVIRAKVKSPGLDPQRLDSYDLDGPIVDFTHADYSSRWGIFQMIGVEGAEQLSSVLMPLTTENEKLLTSIMQRGGAALR